RVASRAVHPQLHGIFRRAVSDRGAPDAPVVRTVRLKPDTTYEKLTTMFVQEAARHGAAAAEGHAEKFNAGETIIHHVANSPIDEPLIHLPKIAGIDFSVTKHV